MCGIKMTIYGEKRTDDKTANFTLDSGKITGKDYGISGNGTRQGTVITINGGSVTAASGVAIHQPQNGNLTINGGELTAPTAVVVKSGSLTVTGGTISGTGAHNDYTHNGNGWDSTGDGLAVEACNYPGGVVSSVNISGGTFKSTNGKPVAYYKQGDYALKNEKFITGGTFTADPTAYVAEGYVAMKNDNGTWTVIAPTAIENGVTIKGIAGYEHRAFATVEDAYDEIKPKVAALGGLGQETCSKEEFVALYTDDAKITWTIYGKQALVAGSEGKDAHTFTFGRAASYYRNDCNIAAIIVTGGNDSAALDLSATDGTFALPYNWWGEDIKNCEVSFTGITFDGVKSIPSTWASQAQSTPYTFDRCTFNGNIYGYHDYNINLTIQNSTFNAPENTAYAVTLQSTTGINGTVTLDHNTFNGYTRGVNLQRPGTDFIFTNNTITSTVSKPDRAAIQLTDGKSFTVTDNTVRVNAGNAFWFHSAATNEAVTYEISNNNIQAPYIGYYATSFDVNPKITSSGNIFNSTDTTRCMEKEATEATATNLTAIN